MILANTLVGPLLGYWIAFPLLFSIIVLEAAIFHAMAPEAVGPWKALLLIALANVISTVAGFAIATQIPWPMSVADSRLTDVEPRLPKALVEAVVIGGQFFVAALLSWWIEAFVLRICCHPSPRRLRAAVAVGNAGSYSLLLALFYCAPQFHGLLASAR